MTSPSKVVVVGSGAGGATTAITLAAAGIRVDVVEEGRRVEASAYGASPTHAMQNLYRRRGMTPILGNVPIGFVEGCCVGGSTEINSGFWHRTPAAVLDRWTSDLRLESAGVEDLAPHFAWAEGELDVREWSRPIPKSTAVLMEGAKSLNWDALVVQRTAGRCIETNTCAQGCPAGAKQGMSFSLIPRSERFGARIFPRTTAIRLAFHDGRVTGVDTETVSDDGSVRLSRLDADAVFLCAGATQTPRILRNSGISRNVGTSLGIHPMVRVVARYAETIDAQSSVLPMIQVTEFGPAIVLGGAYMTPGHIAVMLSDNWNVNSGTMHSIRNLVACYAGITPEGVGRVRPSRLDRRAYTLRYDLTERDIERLREGLLRLCELLFASGAIELYPCVFGVATIRDMNEAKRYFGSTLPAASMSLTSVHAFASCPIDGRPGHGAADGFGRVHGFKNLFVNDASMLPGLARRESPGDHHGDGSAERISVPGVARVKFSKAMVSGAGGWLGSRLVSVLSQGLADTPSLSGFQGAEEIRSLVQPHESSAFLEALPRVRVSRGDIGVAHSLRSWFDGSHGAVLFHCAGIIHPTRSVAELTRVNVDGTRNVVEAAINAGVRRIVHVSSNSPFGFNRDRGDTFDESSSYDPHGGYGRSKREAEKLIEQAGRSGRIETVVVRPPWFYGPYQPPRQTMFFRMVREGRFPIVGSGENRRSMAYIDNLCQGLLLCATSEAAKNRTYWIADRRPYSMNEIVTTVQSVLRDDFGLSVSSKRLRLPGFAGAIARLADDAIQGVGAYSQKVHVLSEVGSTIACSIARAERELGFDPRIDLREGMRRSVKWVLESGQRI